MAAAPPRVSVAKATLASPPATLGKGSESTCGLSRISAGLLQGGGAANLTPNEPKFTYLLHCEGHADPVLFDHHCPLEAAAAAQSQAKGANVCRKKKTKEGEENTDSPGSSLHENTLPQLSASPGISGRCAATLVSRFSASSLMVAPRNQSSGEEVALGSRNSSSPSTLQLRSLWNSTSDSVSLPPDLITFVLLRARVCVCVCVLNPEQLQGCAAVWSLCVKTHRDRK